MDLVKIGKFISSKRKEKNITQSKLAEMLGITERAISKWENGICLPDAATMPELCEILDISINDLFCGEVVDMKNNEKKLEENLLEMTLAKEVSDKRLLNMEIYIGFVSVIILFTMILTAMFIEMPKYTQGILIGIGCVMFFIGMFYALRIEQIAGYYECNNCHHKYIPTYKSVFFAQHINRTRKMKCPKCGKKSWNKKVIH